MNKKTILPASNDLDEAPNWTDDDFNSATHRAGLKPLPQKKQKINITLDPDVVAWFKQQAMVDQPFERISRNIDTLGNSNKCTARVWVIRAARFSLQAQKDARKISQAGLKPKVIELLKSHTSGFAGGMWLTNAITFLLFPSRQFSSWSFPLFLMQPSAIMRWWKNFGIRYKSHGIGSLIISCSRLFSRINWASEGNLSSPLTLSRIYS